MRLAPEPVLGDEVADLLHLVRLRLARAGLNIDDFGDTRLAEDVVISANAFIKSEGLQKGSQLPEVDVRI